MRALDVVDHAPVIEPGLHLRQAHVAHRGGTEDLCLECPVEPFDLAAALRVIGLSVDHRDAELEQPDPQLRPASRHTTPPWRAVVDIDCRGQAIALKSAHQQRLDRYSALVLAS